MWLSISRFQVISYCRNCFLRRDPYNFKSYLKPVYASPLIQRVPSPEKRNDRQPWNSNSLKILGAGLSLGFSLYLFKKTYNKFSFLSTVSAASPFSAPSSNSSLGSGNNKKNFNFIADVVEKVSDGVVFIKIQDHRRRDRYGNTMSLSNGSGFIIESDGLILTNAHVVTNRPRDSSVVVRLSDGQEYDAKIEEMDANSDLALLRINCTNLKPLCLGSIKNTRPGEFVVALGSPLSLSNTITSGVISSVRTSEEIGFKFKKLNYIQTDAAITFGNSGGPLVNLDGEVIGINSMKVTSGISFAIPIDYAVEFIAQTKEKRTLLAKQKKGTLADTGSPRRRYIGITMLTLTPEIIMEMQQRGSSTQTPLPADLSHGILVWRIVVGSPSYYAGLRPGDIITQINGHDIESSREVYKILESHSDLKMVILRGSQRYTVTVAPEE